jgi:hypothetical protein
MMRIVPLPARTIAMIRNRFDLIAMDVFLCKCSQLIWLRQQKGVSSMPALFVTTAL